LQSKGQKCEPLRFPARDTEIGKIIDLYLKNSKDLSDQAIHLLFSANRWELNMTIREKLNQGIHLIVDRYAYSGACFSHAKGLSLEWCQHPDKGLPEPDIVLFLDLDIEKSKKRGAFGSERYEKEEFQKKVRKCFLEMGKKEKNWFVIDADNTIENVTELLLNKVLPVVENVKDLPIGDLYSDGN
jgi:dTMP kinase